MKFTSDILYDELSKWIDDKQVYLSESTASLLRFKTVSGGKTEAEQAQFKNAIDDCLNYLKDMSENFGLNFVNLDGKVCYIEQPEGEGVIAVPVHIDVVPAGDGWRYPAFGGIIARGKIWGRGAQDDKAPLMSCLFGLYGLKQLGVEFKTKTRIIIGTQEEIGDWSDLHYYVQKEGNPVFGFTPDCTFPIINGEKGMFNLKICLKSTPEKANPGNIEFLELTGGDRANIVPDIAFIRFLLPSDKTDAAKTQIETEVREFLGNNNDAKIDFPLNFDKIHETSGRKIAEITFRGEASHGSIPWNGHNAISDALKFLLSGKNIPKAVAIYSEFIFKATLDLYGKGLDIYKFHDFIGPTTVNLGIINLNQEGGFVTLNIRPPIGLNGKEIKERVERVLTPVRKDSGIDIFQDSKGNGTDALFVDPKKNPFYFEAMKTAYQKVTKQPAEYRAIGGTTFAKAFPNTVCFGPVLEQGDEKELAHMKDECVGINELVRNTKIYGYTLGLMTGNVEE